MDADTFIARWAHSGGAERANYGQFLSELCRVIGVPEPEPTQPHERDNHYVFEKTVQDVGEGGKATVRRIDLYRRGAFVLEAKQGVEKEVEDEQRSRQAKGKKRGHGLRGTQGWDAFMERARQQAESYVRLLPEGEGRPPFILVVDVGHVIELYAEFSGTGGVYRPYPNAREHRIRLEDLRQEDTRQLLGRVWLEPLTHVLHLFRDLKKDVLVGSLRCHDSNRPALAQFTQNARRLTLESPRREGIQGARCLVSRLQVADDATKH